MKKKIFQLIILSGIFLSVAGQVRADTLYSAAGCDGNSASVYGSAYITYATTTFEQIGFNIQCTSTGADQSFPFSIRYGFNGDDSTELITDSLTVQCTDTNPFEEIYNNTDITLPPGQIFYVVSDGNSLANTCFDALDVDYDHVFRAGGSLSNPNMDADGYPNGSHNIYGYITPQECSECEEGGGGVCEIPATSTQQNLIEKITKIEYVYTGSTTPSSVSIAEYRLPFILFIFVSILCGFVLVIVAFFFDFWLKRRRRK